MDTKQVSVPPSANKSISSNMTGASSLASSQSPYIYTEVLTPSSTSRIRLAKALGSQSGYSPLIVVDAGKKQTISAAKEAITKSPEVATTIAPPLTVPITPTASRPWYSYPLLVIPVMALIIMALVRFTLPLPVTAAVVQRIRSLIVSSPKKTEDEVIAEVFDDIEKRDGFGNKQQ